MNSKEVQKCIVDIFDYAYTNSPIRIPSDTCREVGKILHVGMYLEEHSKKIPAFDLTSSEQKLLLHGKITDLHSQISMSVRSQYKNMNDQWGLYSDEIRFTDLNIGYIVGKLNGIYISDPDRDVFGDALEIFRSQWAKQEGGQFFTDQKVTSLALRMIDFDPSKSDQIVDLCAGTGGFLLAGLNQIKRIADKKNKDEFFVTSEAKKSLFGFEIDESVVTLGNSTLSARTGSSNDVFITQANSLDKSKVKRKFSKAATNPPFGAKITIQDENILAQYQLAKISNANCNDRSIKSTKTFKRAPDILFVERNVDVLIEGVGQLAIVLPYQIMSGPETYYVRNWLLKNTKILAVIDLPAETFQPHTGTKTCLLVLERLKAPILSIDDVDDYSIFMACPRWIGHDRRGNAVYKKNIDGSLSDEILTDFPELEKAFDYYMLHGYTSDDYKNSYIVSSKTIIEDNLLKFNAAFYNPHNQTKMDNINKEKFDFKLLSSLVDRVFYPGRFKRDYVDKYEHAVPFLGGANITQMIDSTSKWLRHDDPKLEGLAVKEGWILITRSGTTGIVSSVPSRWDGYAISEHVIRIVPSEKVDPEYILAYLKTPQCQAALAQGIFGSVIDEITPETIENIRVPIPKDRALYDAIVKKVRAAEKYRSLALVDMYGAIDDLMVELEV